MSVSCQGASFCWILLAVWNSAERCLVKCTCFMWEILGNKMLTTTITTTTSFAASPPWDDEP